MKNNQKFRFALLTLFAMSILTFGFQSCQKEGATPQAALDQLATNSLYKKEITVSDVSGKNSILLEIGASDQKALEEFNSQCFTLTPLRELPDWKTTDRPDDDNPVQAPAEEDADAVHFTVLEEHLEAGVLGYRMEEKAVQSRTWGSGARWVHGLYVNRGVGCYDPSGCTYGKFYYWVTGTPYFFANFTVCNSNGNGAQVKFSCCAASAYISSGSNYWYYFW